MDAPYWRMQKEELLKAAGTDYENGLSENEVQKRQKEYGKNIIPEKDRRSVLQIFLSQFMNAFIYILMGATVLAFFAGEITQAVTIMAILLMSGILGFYQEYRSENAINELKRYLSHRANAIRGGRQMQINAAELVPGDVVVLHIGDIAPADIRLLRDEDLRMNGASLTGESKEVEKTAAALSLEKPAPHELSNYALMGTTVTYGFGSGVVIATGTKTFFGKTATLLSAKIPESDFQLGMRQFSDMILKVIVIFTVVVFASNAILNHGIVESLLFALAVAVGIAPEILPVITTISLSNGALQMAKEKVVVKKLATIEDIGNMDVLCMDKTGTLTEPGMELEGAAEPGGSPVVDGLILYGMLCNNAHVQGKKTSGNAFDVAISDYAKSKPESAMGHEGYERIDDIEFDFERKRMSVIVKKGGKPLLITKGEPESVLSACSHASMNGKLDAMKGARKKITEKTGLLSEEGYGLLAVATKEVGMKTHYTKEDEEGMVLRGFLLFKSQPKKSAAKSIAELMELGVSLSLLTGDDPAVTAKLCRDVGLEISGGRVIAGSEIEGMDEKRLRKLVGRYNIFARVVPAQKVRIVEAYRSNGHIVGFMGDGVNDAPSLRLADVGISVDTALDVAREAADIVLMKKSLAVLAEGVKLGRKTFGNITKYVLNTISANYGNMFTLVVASFFLPFIPLLPSQILLNNFLSDIPLLTISSDNVDEDFVRKPKRWDIRMISRFMIYFGMISAVFDMLTIALFLYFFGVGAALFRTLWFLESSLSEIAVTFIIRTKHAFFKSMPSRLLITSSLFTATVCVVVVSLPAVGSYFGFVPPSAEQIVLVGGIVLAYCLATEAAKHLFFRHYTEFSAHY
ncbi:magnesium-translocating P-type ATPase [Candidatus Micrarchaeota archaeon]|nr:magnesium-translocating P-type ATPase [Candidatus Micrarchaeota archaeon]